jgi:hypothetical protein
MIGPKWNVDHIAVGPPGVFVLDAKFRSGEVVTSRRGITVDGYRTRIADGLKDQAREVHRRLVRGADIRGWVRPVLVLEAELRGRCEPDGVHIVGVDEVNDYLLDLPRTVDTALLRDLGRQLMSEDIWYR